MRIKKGDTVKMLSGKDRGKTAKVLHVFPKKEKITIEGLNLQKRHRRPRKQGEKGQIVEVPSAVDVSRVMLICPKCSKPTRVGYKVSDDKKFRVCKKCKTEIE